MTSVIWLIAALLLFGCQGPPDFSGASSADVARALVEARRVPGISFAVLQHFAVISSGALGVADVETDEPVRPDTLFEGASLTKPVVATIAMRLFEMSPATEWFNHPVLEWVRRIIRY